jgi:predicted O-methyltransferase YrrM
MTTWMNITRNAFRPTYLPVMLRKVSRRAERNTRAAATKWAKAQAIGIDEYAVAVDEELWLSSLDASRRMEEAARRLLATCPHDLGGGGAFPLLYFLVRLQTPAVVVETGVAAGWSSRAILEALADNGSGRLYSSDFPYFRFADPERYIGYIVPTALQTRWSLDIRGDAVALPEIVRRELSIDLFHYDSDKSYAGRRRAMATLGPLLGPGSVVLMDDIQDNVFFRDYVSEAGLGSVVFEFGGKYVGAIGLPTTT